MTVETHVADNYVDRYLSEIDRYLANYEGGYPIVTSIISHFQGELRDYKQENSDDRRKNKH